MIPVYLHKIPIVSIAHKLTDWFYCNVVCGVLVENEYCRCACKSSHLKHHLSMCRIYYG